MAKQNSNTQATPEVAPGAMVAAVKAAEVIDAAKAEAAKVMTLQPLSVAALVAAGLEQAQAEKLAKARDIEIKNQKYSHVLSWPEIAALQKHAVESKLDMSVVLTFKSGCDPELHITSPRASSGGTRKSGKIIKSGGKEYSTFESLAQDLGFDTGKSSARVYLVSKGVQFEVVESSAQAE